MRVNHFVIDCFMIEEHERENLEEREFECDLSLSLFLSLNSENICVYNILYNLK